MKKITLITIIIFSCLYSSASNITSQSKNKKENSSTSKTEDLSSKSYAWTVIEPLGLRSKASIDTLLYNYYLHSIPSAISSAYATTGNLGGEGKNLIYFEREQVSDFFFRDALEAWLPKMTTLKFYNTRVPITYLSYNSGGDKETAQDRLEGVFSGNVNKRTQIGAMLDFIYSKGSYNYQATKDLIWGASGSYMGDRYELQTYLYHYNMLNKESGGITDDRYITDPAEVQGGTTTVDPKTIPTNFTAAHTRLKGTNLFVNNRYKIGFWDEEKDDEDSVISRTYIPVTSLVWTLNFRENKHMFKSTNPDENAKFFDNTYLDVNETLDKTSYWALSNTFGISLLEGFHKYAKAGLSAFLTHQIRKYDLMSDTLNRQTSLPVGISPLPDNYQNISSNKTENLLWIGGQLTKQRGPLIQYNITGKIGIVGSVVGDIDLSGDISTRFKLLGDSVTIVANGKFLNEEAPYLMKNYISNHFVWNNNFDKIRKTRIGGILDIPHTRSNFNIGVENVQNYIYFNEQCLPTQSNENIQILNASYSQNFRLGILNWDNKFTYQTSSNSQVIPLPKLAIYSNLYLLFKVANVLDVQLGLDCDYFTKYKGLAYQPATMSFYNQSEIEIGDYPFMNLYANMKLSKARFYLMMSHINQGWGDSNYFSLPHYPLNPRRFLFGVSVELAN